LFVPERELKGAALKRGAPGAGHWENNLGSKQNRRIPGQVIFKRSAKQGGLFDAFAKTSVSQQFDRAGLRTAWKYVHLFRAEFRLTRYVE
jgi:hypothetical protein